MKHLWSALFILWCGACKTPAPAPTEAIVVPPAPAPRPFCHTYTSVMDETVVKEILQAMEDETLMEEIVRAMEGEVARLEGVQKNLLGTLANFVLRGDKVMMAHVKEIGLLDDISGDSLRGFWRLVYDLGQILIEHSGCVSRWLAICRSSIVFKSNEEGSLRLLAAAVYYLITKGDARIYHCNPDRWHWQQR